MSCPNHADAEEGLRHCARCGVAYCADCTIVLGGAVICANCKEDARRDRLSGVGDASELASLSHRAAAWFIDQLLYYIVYFGTLASGNSPITFVVASVIFFIYEGVMLTKRGQTLGKMLMRIKVVRADGTPLAARQAWLRAGLRAIFISVLSAINYFPAVVTGERTCIHDIAAGTRVVKAGGPG